MEWSVERCEGLARALLGGTGHRWSHVQSVVSNLRYLSNASTDAQALWSAGWLHDIGYAPELIDTGMHAVDGASFLHRAGVPSEIVALVAFHTGAEFEAEERGLVDRLHQFDRPPQPELDLLILADLLGGPSGAPTTVGERLDEIETRYAPQHPVHRAVVRSRGYLQECAARAAAVADLPDVGRLSPLQSVVEAETH